MTGRSGHAYLGRIQHIIGTKINLSEETYFPFNRSRNKLPRSNTSAFEIIPGTHGDYLFIYSE